MNIITLHLPETSRNLLINENIISIKQKLLFDYVSSIKYINHDFFFNKENDITIFFKNGSHTRLK